MNLRKTIAGAAVALGGTAVMLGLGGTAQAVDAGAQAGPDLDTRLGEVADIGGVVRIDTADPAGPVILGGGTAGTPLDLEIGFGA